MSDDDPLEDYWNTPEQQREALLVSAFRQVWRRMDYVERELRWVKRAMWSLVVAVVVGIIVFQVNQLKPAVPVHATSPHQRVMGP